MRGWTLLLFVLCACDGAIDEVGAGADAAVVGAPDAGVESFADAAPADASAPDAAPPTANTVVSEPGCFLEVTGPTSAYRARVGVPGTRYRRIVIEYTVTHGGWRQDLFDRDVLNHNLMGLSRDVSGSLGRYILGNAAQMRPAEAGYARRSLFYGRVDLEPRPAGQGYQGYTTWRSTLAWTPGATYRVRVVLDAVAGTQRLEVSRGNDAPVSTLGPIPYFEPALTETSFWLDLGGEETDGREVKPYGWTYCDLLVIADPA